MRCKVRYEGLNSGVNLVDIWHSMLRNTEYLGFDRCEWEMNLFFRILIANILFVFVVQTMNIIFVLFYLDVEK